MRLHHITLIDTSFVQHVRSQEPPRCMRPSIRVRWAFFHSCQLLTRCTVAISLQRPFSGAMCPRERQRLVQTVVTAYRKLICFISTLCLTFNVKTLRSLSSGSRITFRFRCARFLLSDRPRYCLLARSPNILEANQLQAATCLANSTAVQELFKRTLTQVRLGHIYTYSRFIIIFLPVYRDVQTSCVLALVHWRGHG